MYRTGFFVNAVRIVVLLCVSLLASGAHAQAQSSDAAAVRASIKTMFDKPGAPVEVDPVSVVKGYAVAGWTQEKQGGRALLRQEKGKWMVVACGGDGMAKADTLKMAGMKQADAVSLEKAVDKAEAAIPAERRRMFALFNGVVKMDGAHGHDAHAAHGSAAPAKAAHAH